jgi:L-seryl-tRNA(Ser) seleniumtransferase
VNDPRRELPSVEQVIAALRTVDLPQPLLAEIGRRVVDEARDSILDGATPTRSEIIAAAEAEAKNLHDHLLGRVINATGVLLHTNLGRAQLGVPALDAIRDAATSSNLEYDLATGARGSRHAHAGHLLAAAVGAEAGIVVNNNAAAVMLVLAALARDREVVVSRGELVEIGGGFRVPDVLRESGARLIEVGTTNRSRAADFAGARSPATAMFLRVHASNYRIIGFTEQPEIHELATLGVDVVVDAGSGLLDRTTPWLDAPPSWLHDEPGVRQCIADGAALVTFSGDKLLGGPQAGIIVGRRDLVDQCKRHPLARAVRADKLTIAALQSVAFSYLRGTVVDDLPFWSMATATLARLRARAEVMVAEVQGTKIVDTEAAAGGGSLPGFTIPSVGVALPHPNLDAALARLRSQRIVALARDGAVVVDLRSVDAADDVDLASALRSVNP